MAVSKARKMTYSTVSESGLRNLPDIRALPTPRSQRNSVDTLSDCASSADKPQIVKPGWLVSQLNNSGEESLLFEIIKQKWSGIVIESNDEEVHVILKDLSQPNNPNEFAVIYREEIDPHLQSSIKQGAEFYWHIGYREGKRSPRQRFSKIRFRNFPKWTQVEIDSASQKAKEYAAFFSAD
ncbi:hypothetical protein [Cellvibrio fontiphilus]|uniref:Uncharacterized protein n=1 Tax=Cellvibrio fontiphilus TaxID=1815559 RepID=A0ABV7FGS6_9GAMM